MDPTTGDLGVVLNPRLLHGSRAGLWAEALARLRAERSVECVTTAGDGGDRGRIAEMIEAARPAVVVAAGGDGTVRDVAQVLSEIGAATAPALAILPFGTANNVARSLGLTSLRGRHGRTGLEPALRAALGGTQRPFDLGCVGPQVFTGAFAVGMDGAILAARNRWRRVWHLGPRTGGYALYLLSCAANLARQRRVSASLSADGVSGERAVYNLLVTNIPLYAGEFRFDDDDHSADGRLDLQVFSGPFDYVRAFVAAWRRHLRRERGTPVRAAARLRRVEHIELSLSAPSASQLDGEEGAPAAQFGIRVLPSAIRIKVPPP